MSLPSPYHHSQHSQYKPSPLRHGSPPTSRTSPFRRAETPASPSPLRYFTVTPNGSPTKADADTTRLNDAAAAAAAAPRVAPPPTTPTPAPGPPAGPTTPARPTTPEEQASEPTMTAPPYHRSPSSGWGGTTSSKSLGSGNALSQLQPAQVKTLRDGFQILDRDCDGIINKDDVADMLNQLGLPSGPTDVGLFFPPAKPQTLTLAAFLNSLAETLAVLSSGSELMSAFSTFDDDDSGQVDWAELREALLQTPPEAGQRTLGGAEVDKVVEGFTGRRAFNRNMNAHLAARRGEVFKYQEFVNSIMGTNGGSDGGSHQSPEDQ